MSTIEITKVNTLTGHKDCLYTLEKYNDHQFFSAGGDGMVVIWDLRDPETGQMVVKIPASIYALSFNRVRNHLIVGQNFSGIHLVDVESKKEVGSLALTSAAIFDIQSTDEAIYVGTGEGEVIEVSWDMKMLRKKKFSDQSARTIAINRDRGEIAVGYSDQRITVLDLDLNGKRDFKGHEISVFTLHYHPQMPILMSGSRDAKIKLWDTDHEYKLVGEIVGHMYAINHIEFSPDNQHFVTCSMDKSIKVWDANEFRLLKVIDRARHAGHATSVNKLLWMDYQNWLVSCSDDRSISIWDINFAQ